MTLADPYGVTPTIVGVAQTLGVDPNLAIADAEVESGLNPSALGDGGTSVGLYQLHWGGELNQLGATFAQASAAAEDPAANAGVALAQFAQIAAAHPGADPGQIAALAERPANQAAYAAQVDQAYTAVAASGAVASLEGGAAATGGYVVTPALSIGGFHVPGTGSIGGNIGPNIPKAAGNAVTSAVGAIGPYLLEGVFLLGAVGLVVLGMWRAAQPKIAAKRQQATEAATTAAAAGAL